MFNPKQYPTLLAYLATVMSLRQARVMIKTLKITPRADLNDLDDAHLTSAFVFNLEQRGSAFWHRLNRKILSRLGKIDHAGRY